MARGGARPGAGRKPGFNQMAAEELRAYLITAVDKEKQALVDALIVKAKNGDVQALKEVFERAIGKVKEQVEITQKIDTLIVDV